MYAVSFSSLSLLFCIPQTYVEGYVVFTFPSVRSFIRPSVRHLRQSVALSSYSLLIFTISFDGICWYSNRYRSRNMQISCHHLNAAANLRSKPQT